MTHPAASSLVRQPRQARSRAGWERVLAAGRELLESGGYEALSVSEVCRRAGITAPSLYARVDGRAGLFRAVYEDAMREVGETEDELLSAAGASVADVVAAVTEIFDRHAPLLRAVIHRAVEDPWLLEQGSTTSRRLQNRIAAALPGSDLTDALSAARLIYTECAFRTIYGPRFWTDEPESAASFTARVAVLVERALTVEA